MNITVRLKTKKNLREIARQLSDMIEHLTGMKVTTTVNDFRRDEEKIDQIQSRLISREKVGIK